MRSIEEDALQTLGLVLTEGDRKIMLGRGHAEPLLAMEGLPLKIQQRGIAYEQLD